MLISIPSTSRSAAEPICNAPTTSDDCSGVRGGAFCESAGAAKNTPTNAAIGATKLRTSRSPLHKKALPRLSQHITEFRMLREIRAHKRTARHDLKTPLAHDFEHASGEPRSDAAAASLRRRLRVFEPDHAASEPVIHERRHAVGIELEAGESGIVAHCRGHER